MSIVLAGELSRGSYCSRNYHLVRVVCRTRMVPGGRWAWCNSRHPGFTGPENAKSIRQLSRYLTNGKILERNTRMPSSLWARHQCTYRGPPGKPQHTAAETRPTKCSYPYPIQPLPFQRWRQATCVVSLNSRFPPGQQVQYRSLYELWTTLMHLHLNPNASPFFFQVSIHHI
jgi:hypothetical protein